MQQRSLTGRRLAERSHVSVNTVRQVLRGKSKPSIGKLLALATALEVPLDLLFGDSPIASLIEEAETPNVSGSAISSEP